MKHQSRAKRTLIGKLAPDTGENINLFYKNHQKFIIGVKLGLKYVKEVLEKERENLQVWSNLHTQFGAYGICRTIEWDYEQQSLQGRYPEKYEACVSASVLQS